MAIREGGIHPPPLAAGAVAGGLAVGVLAVSTAAILIRVADAPALSLAFYRCAGGALALAPFALRSLRRSSEALPYRLLVTSGGLLALHFALWISSLSYTTVASAAVLVTMSVLFVAAGAAVFLAEPAGRRTWVGICLAMAGAVGVTLADVSGPAFGVHSLLGNSLALGGAVMVAGYFLIGRLARRRLPVTVYASAVYGVAAVVLLGACLAAGTPLAGYPAATWLAIAGLVVGPQLLGHTVFNALLANVSATVVAVVVLAEPVGATVLAWLVLGELPAPGFWVAAPVIGVGVYLAATRGRPAAPGPGRQQALADRAEGEEGAPRTRRQERGG